MLQELGSTTPVLVAVDDIAMLAAEGLSNRAIAQRTFVSVKTVEANLGRVYRKLGITSRPQLVHALDQLMQAGP